MADNSQRCVSGTNNRLDVGYETDVDCGGSSGRGCMPGEICAVGDDCPAAGDAMSRLTCPHFEYVEIGTSNYDTDETIMRVLFNISGTMKEPVRGVTIQGLTMRDARFTYLDAHGNELGVLLVEPQWGSSVAAMPWPPKLLKAYIAAAKERGIAVVCDEVMCGLGRHGAEPNGGTGCFLSECWDLQPDIVTFGKAIGGGAGHLLSGAIVLNDASKMAQGSKTAFQSHTYAGSSARALANGAGLLDAIPTWRSSVNAIGDAIAPIVAELNEASGGAGMDGGPPPSAGEQ